MLTAVADELPQAVLAHEVRKRPKVFAIEPRQVECLVDNLGTRLAEFAPQLVKVGEAAFERHRLAIDDCALSLEAGNGFGDRTEFLRPVVAAPGEDLGLLVP